MRIQNPAMDPPAFPYLLVRPDDALAHRGLRVLVGGPEAGPGLPLHGGTDVSERLQGFLAYAQSIHLDIVRQVLAIEPSPSSAAPHAGRIVGMCLWVPAPGKTAMLFAPSLSEFPEAAAATQAAIKAALEDAQAHGTVLVQAMMEPADAAGKTVFAAAGLAQLATLTYMERRPPLQPPAFTLPSDLLLEPYHAATHEIFKKAIAASYEQTLDCPAMSGMRDMDDVIEGHKAVGLFDPQLWGVLTRWGKPAGCLLLAEIPARRALELVYLGLAPEARGQRLGRLLMTRVLAIAARRHFEVATLAVDASNGPAVRLYRRCGYTSVAQRVAMIKRF
jgi:ribosomal protein S18 acetylase RimI-like enzyme